MYCEKSKYRQFRGRFADLLRSEGCQLRDPQPLAHPGLSTNFTMSLAVTLLPEDTFSEVQPVDYGVIQPCLRVHDSKQVAEDNVPWHLTFFEMAGAVVDGKDPRRRALDILLNISKYLLGLNRQDLRFSVFSGGGQLKQPADARTVETLASMDIPDSAVVYSEECYFGKRQGEKVAGPSVEVFVRSPDGAWRELATIVLLDMAIGRDGRLTPARIPIAEIGLGLERAYCTFGKLHDITECEPIANLMPLFQGHNLHDQLLMADRLRAVCFALSEGVSPGRKGRSSVLRGFIREIFELMKTDYLSEDISRAVERVVLNYGVEYPKLCTPRICAAIEQERQHELQRRAGKKF